MRLQSGAHEIDMLHADRILRLRQSNPTLLEISYSRPHPVHDLTVAARFECPVRCEDQRDGYRALIVGGV